MNDPLSAGLFSVDIPDELPNLDGFIGVPHVFNETGWIEPVSAAAKAAVLPFAQQAKDVDGERLLFDDMETWDLMADCLAAAGFRFLVGPN